MISRSVSPCTEPLGHFLDRNWARLLAGEELCAERGEVEDPGERFEWFEGSGDPDSLGARCYVMPLRDRSRIRVDVGPKRVRFRRDRFDPRVGIGSALRYALCESALARGARALLARH